MMKMTWFRAVIFICCASSLLLGLAVGDWTKIIWVASTALWASYAFILEDQIAAMKGSA